MYQGGGDYLCKFIRYVQFKFTIFLVTQIKWFLKFQWELNMLTKQIYSTVFNHKYINLQQCLRKRHRLVSWRHPKFGLAQIAWDVQFLIFIDGRGVEKAGLPVIVAKKCPTVFAV